MTSTALASALQGLDQALDAPRREGVQAGNWRWVTRQRLAAVRDALIDEGAQDGWLQARGGSAFRERYALLGRVAAAGPQVLETADLEQAREELKRLLADVSRHVQRLQDLGSDDAASEVGGPE